MSAIFEDTLQGLIEAISIEKDYSQEETLEKIRKLMKQDINKHILDELYEQITIFLNTQK